MQLYYEASVKKKKGNPILAQLYSDSRFKFDFLTLTKKMMLKDEPESENLRRNFPPFYYECFFSFMFHPHLNTTINQSRS